MRAWAGGGLALRGSGPWFPRDDGWSSCLFTGQGLETAQRVSERSWMSFLVISRLASGSRWRLDSTLENCRPVSVLSVPHTLSLSVSLRYACDQGLSK